MGGGDESVKELYGAKAYPPMSHPSSDPAVVAVAARFGGLSAPDPASASILEIGCASGHNLLPLAVRWPESRCVGVDLSKDAVADAARRAGKAGISNAGFSAVDLREMQFPGERFDYIIAHGVFSWVTDDAKQALLEFCAKHLSPRGVAVISFNLLSGWESRLPVVDAVKRICGEHNVDVIHGLNILREVTGDDLKDTIDDMIAKGPEILAFDDFAPVNDPWPLNRFAAACVASGLHWLGESDPAENIPSDLDAAARAALEPLVGDPLRMQMTADAMAGRTFRSGLLCRIDAPLEPRMSVAMVLDLCVRIPGETVRTDDPNLRDFVAAMKPFGASCVPVKRVVDTMPDADLPAVARSVFRAITDGLLKARIGEVNVDRSPEVCRLGRFNAVCAEEDLPLVDAWHQPCLFPERPRRLLSAMNGKPVAEAAELAAEICPDLAFPVWMEHLASRGLLEPLKCR